MKYRIIRLVADGFYKQAISLHTQLHSASHPPTHLTFPPLLKACAKLNSPLQAQTLHAHILKTGFYSHTHTATALVAMYMQLTLFSQALKVLDEMPHPTLPSLNATISGFSQNGFFTEALLVFRKVGFCEFRCNSVTIASVLPACESLKLCAQVHCWGVKLGMDVDVYVGTSLLTVYFKCGEVVLGSKLFDEMSNKNVVSYNAFVSGLLLNGLPKVVLNVFKDMLGCTSREKPNSVTLINVVCACASLLDVRFGRQVHGFVMKNELVFDTKVGTAFIDMYSKCGRWHCAYDVFRDMNGGRNLITWNSMIAGMMSNGQNVIAVELFELLKSEGLEPDSATWNSMISGMAQLEKGVEALSFFRKMQSSGVVPSLKSITSVLPACASLSNLLCGKEIHGHAIRIDINSDEFLATSLIDMYMKCGFSSWARRIFDQLEIKSKDPAFWNAMMSGYGRNGEDETAFEIFDQMLEEKVVPNSATFTAVLSVCSHTGQVNKGWQVFRLMTSHYGLNPKPEHFGCMVDLLGRSGRVDEARELIQDVPEPSASLFSSLLGACRHHLHSELGEEMAMKLSELEPENPAPFVILSNIYADMGRWGDVERIRQVMDDRGLHKLPGSTQIGGP